MDFNTLPITILLLVILLHKGKTPELYLPYKKDWKELQGRRIFSSKYILSVQNNFLVQVTEKLRSHSIFSTDLSSKNIDQVTSFSSSKMEGRQHLVSLGDHCISSTWLPAGHIVGAHRYLLNAIEEL